MVAGFDCYVCVSPAGAHLQKFPTNVSIFCACLSVGEKAELVWNGGLGEQEYDNTWVYGLSGICICIIFVMGMGVFSALYFGIPGRFLSLAIGVVQ